MGSNRRLDNAAFRNVAEAYLTAKRLVLDAGYADEVDWQEAIDVTGVDEKAFLRETAWVILSAGMSERVVRSRFRGLSTAFLDWASAATIDDARATCRRRAFAVFAHPGKIEAILDVAQLIRRHGFATIWEECLCDPIPYLSRLPYVGPTTSFHLAKNLGFGFAKPDRHLTRIAFSTGYASPHALCQDLADGLGEKLSVVDIVMWRHALLAPDYQDMWRATRLQ